LRQGAQVVAAIAAAGLWRGISFWTEQDFLLDGNFCGRKNSRVI
jgi:hypothetical protein